MPASEDTFARLVSLAVHDLRTPLATVSGFARTLERTRLGDPADRYVAMMIAACGQLTELLEDLGTVARIEAGRWEPNVQEVDSLELGAAAIEPLGDAISNEGHGATVQVDVDATAHAIQLLCACGLRHGGLDHLRLDVNGPELSISEMDESTVEIVTAQNMRDLGAAVAVRILETLGARVEPGDSYVAIHLPWSRQPG